MTQHRDGRMHGQAGHDAGHDQVRPGTAGAEHTQRRGQHGEVAERIVAGAQPHAAHVAVAVAVGIQQHRHADIGQQRQATHQAHGRRAGHLALPPVPKRSPQHTEAEHQHADGLELGGAGAPGQGHAQHPEADAVVGGIAEKVQRVGQQRHRASLEASADLDQEHRQVDQQRNPQDAPVAAIVVARSGVVVAAVSAHLASPYRSLFTSFWIRARQGKNGRGSAVYER